MSCARSELAWSPGNAVSGPGLDATGSIRTLGRFFHSFDKYLPGAFSVPSSLLCSRDMAMIRQKTPWPGRASILVGKDSQIKDKHFFK